MQLLLLALIADAGLSIYALLLVAASLTAGLILGGCAARLLGPRRLDSGQAVEFLSGLFQWTSDVAQEMAEYRSVMNRLAETCATDAESESEASPARSNGLLQKMMAANEKLQQRLNDAELALQQQSTEISGYVSEARTDPLTRLENRRAFDEQLHRRFAEWRRHNTPLSVLLVDIDHFKKFNDTHGHLAGDEVLVQVAQVMRKAMRESDVVARFGGEEFAMILPASDWEDGSRAAERIRRAVENTIVRYEEEPLGVTVSCGVAQASGTETVEQLIKRADEALYASKDAGRNFAHLHDSQKCVPLTNANRSAPRTAPGESFLPAVPCLSPSARRGAQEETRSTDFEPEADAANPASSNLPDPQESGDSVKRSFDDVCRRLQQRLSER